jgi:4-alpha-glucanotransferase
MGVQRLWWIPEGASAADGAYVRYPREELLAIIAAEAHRSATTIVGEDLGTVSDEVREALTRWDVIGMYEELFHLQAPALPRPPRRSVAGLRTHDMPAFAATVADVGIDALAGYREHVAGELGRPVAATADGLLDGALERLARSEADVVLADLDDLTGETAPHNVPGLVLDTTWRRRLPEPTSDVLTRPVVRERLRLLAARGRADARVRPPRSTGGDGP